MTIGGFRRRTQADSNSPYRASTAAASLQARHVLKAFVCRELVLSRSAVRTAAVHCITNSWLVLSVVAAWRSA